MAIPKFTEFMLPMLEWLKNGEAKHYKEFSPFIVEKFKLSNEDQNILLKSGQPLFENRHGWAKLYLKRAGLLETPQKGLIKITEEGLKLCKSGKTSMSVKDFDQYPKYQEWKAEWKSKKTEDDTSHANINEDLPPEELIEANVQKLNELLINELLERVKGMHPSDFEHLVVKLLTSMGYGSSLKDAGVVIGKSGDGGIDGIISEDRLGLSKIYIQAKRWENSVGDVELRNFIGSISSRGATKGVFITTSDYTRQAKETIDKNKSSMEIVLINGKELTKLMLEFNLGVSPIATYQIKKIDSDFFE